MSTSLLPLISYVFVTTFTPGPNNISSASMGMNYGFRTTLPYLLGIYAGFMGIMLAAGAATETITRVFPRIETILRYIGAAYMVWLAVSIVRSTTESPESKGKPIATWRRGFFLQVVNPKVIIYGITVFSAFLTVYIDAFWQLLLAAFVLASTAFLSISVWTLFGSVINRVLHRYRYRLIFNCVMGLLLLYSALSLLGLW
jgi:cysteine/O-acetylserine efflux protein